MYCTYLCLIFLLNIHQSVAFPHTLSEVFLNEGKQINHTILYSENLDVLCNVLNVCSIMVHILGGPVKVLCNAFVFLSQSFVNVGQVIW